MYIVLYMVRTLLLTFALLIGFKAQALEVVTDCSDLPKLQKAWEERYYYDFKFQRQLPRGPVQLACGMPLFKVIQALWFIEKSRTSSSVNYYEVMRKHITEIVLTLDPKPGSKDACAQSDNEMKPGQIVLFACFFNIENSFGDIANIGLIYRVATLIHESRHAEGGAQFEHTECNGACDKYFDNNITTAGPYSYEILYLEDVLKNSDKKFQLQSAIKFHTQKTLNNNFSYGKQSSVKRSSNGSR